MELDFTALNNIPLHIGTTNAEGNLALKPQKPATGQNIALQAQPAHTHQLDQVKQERERTREMYATYQENIQRAGELRSDILKGIQTGEDPLALLLRAIECISLMTGDSTIYTQSKADILAVYGWGLGEPAPLEQDLEEARERLARLESIVVNAEGLPEQERDRTERRLQNAIRQHRELIERLEQTLARTQPEDYRDINDILGEVIQDLRRKGAEHGQ